MIVRLLVSVMLMLQFNTYKSTYVILVISALILQYFLVFYFINYAMATIKINSITTWSLSPSGGLKTKFAMSYFSFVNTRSSKGDLS